MTQVIEVIISAKGETRVQTKGCAGASCRQRRPSLSNGCATGPVVGVWTRMWRESIAATELRPARAGGQFPGTHR